MKYRPAPCCRSGDHSTAPLLLTPVYIQQLKGITIPFRPRADL